MSSTIQLNSADVSDVDTTQRLSWHLDSSNGGGWRAGTVKSLNSDSTWYKVIYYCDAETTDPTTDPTTYPTTEPTTNPTTEPSMEPTSIPSTDPTKDPTTNPSAEPSISPSTDPTRNPSMSPVLYIL